NYITNNDKKLNTCTVDNKGKSILQDLYLQGYSNEPTGFYHKSGNCDILNIPTVIHQYILTKYGEERYKRNASSIDRFFRASIDGYYIDIDIIATIFLLRELLSAYRTERLFDYKFNLRDKFKKSVVSVLEYVNQVLDYNVENELKLF